ncbi:ABC transporter ATP-binding protein [Paenibacillus crassostreae]|uniref:ABC transporter domain-containing protein n=1 Tax=Paenibacillus crassostreae TaxID=1763538 RepID=A0A167FHV6_9BACL|nr:ATP-binding cassette domain-containing protein [Paenibacillus crassostreae]OAB76575.1 hypothetical protein PNBC_04010 [Paenibacillus crassostreae]
MNILEISKLYKTYGDQTILNDLSATISIPERIALLGKSGQGKSTLLRILCRLETQDLGGISFQGRSYLDMDVKEWRKKISYVSQQSYMLQGSVEDNLRTVSQLHRTDFDIALAKQLMAALNLEHLDWNKSSSELSGGEKQRVALARTLLLKPEVILLDEVTASLDMESKYAVETLLIDWQREKGNTFIWITHDLEQAERISNRIWFIEGGSLVEDGES